MKTKILLTVLTTLSLNMLWGQWVEKATGEATTEAFKIMDCPDESTCYIASDYKLMRSANGGDTWIDRTSNIPISVGSATFASIECTDPNTCLCVYGATIYKTADGGQNWSSVSQPDQGSTEFQMLDAQNGYSHRGSEYKFAKTTDFGNTWTSFSYLSGIPFNVQDVGNKFSFITPEIGIMAFYANSRNAIEIYKTIDGGLNWTKKYDTINPPMNYGVRAMDMVTLQVGYIITTFGEVLKTTDGGESWFQATPITFVTSFEGVMDVEFIDKDNGYVSGKGYMYKTTDGGETWISELTPINTPLPEIEIINYDLVYVSAYYENIFKNSNAGLIANIFDLENNAIGKVYPNPSNDQISIEIDQNNFGSNFQVFDLLGNRLLEQNLSMKKTTLQCGDLPSGVYLFQITNKNTVLGTGKLVFN